MYFTENTKPFMESSVVPITLMAEKNAEMIFFIYTCPVLTGTVQ